MSKVWVIVYRAKNAPDDEFDMIGYSTSKKDAEDKAIELNSDESVTDSQYKYYCWPLNHI